MYFKKLLFAVLILTSSFLIFNLIKREEFDFQINIIINAPKEKVFNCMKNKFKNVELFKKLDADNTAISLEQINMTTNNYHTFIVKEHLMLNLFKLRVELDVHTEIDQKNYIIVNSVKSRDGLVNATNKFTLVGDNFVKVMENEVMEVPKLFKSYSKKFALEEHTNNMVLLKKELESNPNMCDL